MCKMIQFWREGRGQTYLENVDGRGVVVSPPLPTWPLLSTKGLGPDYIFHYMQRVTKKILKKGIRMKINYITALMCQTDYTKTWIAPGRKGGGCLKKGRGGGVWDYVEGGGVILGWCYTLTQNMLLLGSFYGKTFTRSILYSILDFVAIFHELKLVSK